MPITWDDFNLINKLNKEVAFQQLAHYLFLHRYGISSWKIKQHSNQAGIEIEPIKIEMSGKEMFASYQAKHFNRNLKLGVFREEVEKSARRKYEGDYAALERIDFYLNKDLAQSNQARDNIEKMADEAGISIHWHYGEEILLELNHPSADDELKAIVARFFTGIEASRRIRIPEVDIPLAKVVGRSELTAKIRQALQEHQRVQLFGLPGVGKSTLAQYVVASEEAILGATIVNARELSIQGGETESVEKQVQLLAEKAVSKFVKGKVEGNVLELAKELFRSDKRLLVIDNLEAPELIRGFVEAVRPARLLLTSRREATHDLVDGVSFRVDELSPDAAREQFCNDSGLYEGHEREAVDEICSLLGYLPLAINLLAVQIKNYFDGSPIEALNILQQKRLAYLERYEDFSANPENNLRLSFELSYENLKPEQKHVFQIMGALMPSGTNFASIIYMSGLEEFPVKRALVELKQRSLMSFSEGKYFLHPLLWEYAEEKFEAKGDVEMLRTRTLQLIYNLLQGFNFETLNPDLELYELYWEQITHLTVRVEIKFDDFLALAHATHYYLTQTSQFWVALDHIGWILTNIQKLEDRSTEAVYLGMQGSVYRNLGLHEEAKNIHERVLEFAKEYNLRELEGVIFGNLGNDFYDVGEFEKSFDCQKQSAQINREVGDKLGEIAAIHGQANTLRYLGRLEEAYELSAIALFVVRTIGYRNGELFALTGFASSVAGLFGSTVAKELYKEALQLAQELRNRKAQASLLHEIGQIEWELDNYGKALECFKYSVSIAHEIEDSWQMLQTFESMGGMWLNIDEPEEALRCYDIALELAQESGDSEQEVIQLSCLGDTYLALGQLEEALSYYTKALVISEQTEQLRGISKAKNNLGTVHYLLEDYRTAYSYYLTSLNSLIKNQDYEGVGLNLMFLGGVFNNLNNHQHTVAFWVAACPILKRESKLMFEILVEALIDTHKSWQEFNKFLEKLVSGTNDELVEAIREIGLLEEISQDYVMKLVRAE